MLKILNTYVTFVSKTLLGIFGRSLGTKIYPLVVKAL